MAEPVDDYGSTIAKRKLSRIYLELRKQTGMTANQVCDLLGWGRGKVGRIEGNVWKRPEMSDLRDLNRIYKIDESDTAAIEKLAMLSRTRQWWREYPDVFDNEFPGFESDASEIFVYMPLVLPGLLQTPAYIDAHMNAGVMPPAWRDRMLETRLRRQRILDRTNGTAPHVHAVITEASLAYHWGTRKERQDQLSHLVELSQRPNIEIRLFRFADGPHPGMSSLINIFEFPDDDEPGQVYLENDVAIQEVSADANSVASASAYRQMFSRIENAALTPEATTSHLQELAKTLE